MDASTTKSTTAGNTLNKVLIVGKAKITPLNPFSCSASY